MAYATPSDLIQRFGAAEIESLSTRVGGGSADPAVIADALADAEATINSYVGRRYRLPLGEVSARLTRVACDLARRYLYSVRPTDEVIAAEKRALDWLRDVSSGAAVLDVVSPQGDATTNHPGTMLCWPKIGGQSFAMPWAGSVGGGDGGRVAGSHPFDCCLRGDVGARSGGGCRPQPPDGCLV
jgi:phage gp36-like protein